MFLAITESKKIVSGEGDDSQVSFEKHKIFLYKEDFEKFMNGLQQAIQFIAEEQGPIEPHHTENEKAVQNYCLFPTWQKESTIFLSLCFLYRLESEIDIYFNFIRTKRLVSVFGRFLFFIFSVMANKAIRST